MNYHEMENNQVRLTGTITGKPRFSHEVLGEGFFELSLSVKRLSGQEDIIPLTVSERLLENHETQEGQTLCVAGQFRSYNKQENEKSKLMLTVFVREILSGNEEENPNVIKLTGYVCKQPVYRTTPFKREICDILLAVNRAYNKSDYIPCIAWGRNARYAANFRVGEKITVTGRIQSRNYQKAVGEETVTKTAFEVSVSKIDKADSVEEYTQSII